MENKDAAITGYTVRAGEEVSFTEFTVRLGELTDEERQIILDGCLINYNGNRK